MANKKFSQFTAQTSLDSTTGFLVGYDSALGDNVRITEGNLKTSLNIGIDDVLAVGQGFTTSRSINAGGASFQISGLDPFQLVAQGAGAFIFQFGPSYVKTLYNNPSSVEQGILIDALNDTYKFGNWDSGGSGTMNKCYASFSTAAAVLELNTLSLLSNQDCGLFLDAGNGYFVTTYDGGQSIGFLADYANGFYRMGDWQGLFAGNAYLNIDAGTSSTSIGTDNLIFDSASMIQGTAGSSASQYLKVNVNGNNYVIALLNP